MSEAVINAEIEDVLSSIRRLVSENAAVESHKIDPAPARPEVSVAAHLPERAEQSGGAPGKLVLTPAFRVHDGGPETKGARVSETDGDEVAEDTPPNASNAQDGSKPPAQAAPNSLETRIAELEAAVGDSPEWEPDGSEDEVSVQPTVVFEHAAWNARADMGDTTKKAGFADLTGTGGLCDAAGEVISITPATAEDDAPAMDQDAAPADPPEAGADAQPEQPGFEEALIDEEVLRGMVRQLVREELQGTVGERITRKVRSLVRREIQRALTLQDFE